jgi:hypothetical protein
VARKRLRDLKAFALGWAAFELLSACVLPWLLPLLGLPPVHNSVTRSAT